MEQEIHITLRFSLATGKAGLNEIVYKLKEVRNPLMLKILERVLCWLGSDRVKNLKIQVNWLETCLK
jgi:2'-5' RNA ligase